MIGKVRLTGTEAFLVDIVTRDGDLIEATAIAVESDSNRGGIDRIADNANSGLKRSLRIYFNAG
jgi:hypothetical protein